MKKFLAFVSATFVCLFCHAQQTSSLSNFLKLDVKQVMQKHIEVLNYQLASAKQNLSFTNDQLSSLQSATNDETRFLLLFHKLEDSLPLNAKDSLMIEIENLSSPNQIIIINVNGNALENIIGVDSLYMNSFPKLQAMISNQRLIIHPEYLSKAEAPAIAFPPMPTLSSTKKQTAAALMAYINNLNRQCQVTQADFAQYIKIQKAKVPDGNLDKLIDLREKFIIFVEENYCNK